MSEILSNIVVQQTNINFVPDNNNINITPDAIQLNLYSGGVAIPGGSLGQLQYNNGTLGGIPGVTYTSGNLNLGNVANVKMLGGANTQVLQTDGTGNLSWAPQIGGTGNSSSGQLLFNNSGNVSGVANSNVSSGTLTFTNLSNLKINGGTNGYVLQTDGVGNLGWTAMTGGGGNGTPGGSNTQIQYNDGGVFGGSSGFTFDKISNAFATPGNASVGGNLTVLQNANIVGNIIATNFTGNGGNLSNVIAATVSNAAQPNITSVGNLTSLNVGNATSNVLIAATGTITATGKFSYSRGGNVTQTPNRSANVTINALTGTITAAIGNLAPNGTFSIGMQNDKVEVNDMIIVTHKGGGDDAAYLPFAYVIGTGNADIVVRSVKGANSVNQQPQFQFIIFKSPV